MNISLPWVQDKFELKLPENWQIVFPKASEPHESFNIILIPTLGIHTAI